MSRRKKKDDELDESGEIVSDFKPTFDLVEIEKYLTHEDPVVVLMANFVILMYSQPELRIYSGLVKVANKIADELEGFSEKKILTNDKDDKGFERVTSMFKSLEDYSKGLGMGRKVLQQMGAAEDGVQKKSKNFFAEQAKLHGDNK